MMSSRAYSFSSGILGDPAIGKMLDREVCVPRSRSVDKDDIVVGWGNKANTVKPQDFAKQHELPWFRLEDGFFCYLDHPTRDRRRLSVVVDDSGIYYDARHPSALETVLATGKGLTAGVVARAEAIIPIIRDNGLSKFNGSRAPFRPADYQMSEDRPCILVVDQTKGDLSIAGGLSDASSFQTMLASALDDNPDAQVLVKIHPDVILGKKTAHLASIKHERVQLLSEDVELAGVFAHVDAVYVVTSQVGFEALIHGCKVHTFGMPFYAGWGLTEDQLTCDRRGQRRSLGELVAASCILYARYYDPHRDRKAEFEEIISLLAARHQGLKPSVNKLYVIDVSTWKRGFLRGYLKNVARSVVFRRKLPGRKELVDNDVILTWGRKGPHYETEGTTKTWRMEDGFIRSIGLGSHLNAPSSLVFDQTGIYFDATSPSDLETFLTNYNFRDLDRARARALIDTICDAGLSKYNVGEALCPDFRARAGARKVLLVPGQVEDDASIRYGTQDISTNKALLAEVRRLNPEAFVVYKPHPDTRLSARPGLIQQDEMLNYADEEVVDLDIIACINGVDEVHTMTSLSGFEALLRGRSVTTYGKPFYAGWGITHDRQPVGRRGRQLTLEELVYGSLVVYPCYFDITRGVETSVEAVVDAMKVTKEIRGNAVAERVGPFRKIMFFVQGLMIKL